VTWCNPPATTTALAIDDRYFVYLGADSDLLTSLGFRFAEPQRPAP
jgi:hypothetical protein